MDVDAPEDAASEGSDSGVLDTVDIAEDAADDAGEDATDGDDLVDVADPGTPPEDVAPVDPNAPLVLPPAAVDGYLPGGLLGWYWAGKAFTPEDELLTQTKPFEFAFETSASFTVKNSEFLQKNGGKPMTVLLEGAVHIDEPGEYLVGVTANDSARLRISDVDVFEVWNAGELTSVERLVVLESGWHPIELLYGRKGWAAHLELRFTKPGDLSLPLAGAQLGFPVDIPETVGPLTGVLNDIQAGVGLAKVAATASIPARLLLAKQPASEPEAPLEVVSANYQTTHHAVFELGPALYWTVNAVLEDPWGRQFPLGPKTVKTKTAPTGYVPGGLLGAYYSGEDSKTFGTQVATRWDPVVHHPKSLDGNVHGSFAMPMSGDHFSVVWSGGLKVTQPGLYTLHLGADDGQRLFVDGVEVASNWTDHGLQYVTAALNLEAGWHMLEAHMYENGGAAACNLEWESATMERVVIPTENLGALLPGDDGATPEVLELSATLEEGGALRVTLFASELVQGALTVVGADGEISGELAVAADAFVWRSEPDAPPPSGPLTISVLVFDLSENPAPAAEFSLPE